MNKSEEITCNVNKLYVAAKTVIKKSPNKSETKQFELHMLDYINQAQRELHDRKWYIIQKKPFILRERGHVRRIQGNTPYDRMIIHSYIDNVLTPLLQPYLIYDNYASQKDKGTGLARKRFRKFMHQAYREYSSNNFYILLIDFSKYYDNIRHDYLKEQIFKYIPPDDREFNEYMINTILDSFKVDVSYMSDEEYENCLNTKYNALDHLYETQTNDKYMAKSLNIGNQASQLFSVFYSVPIDNYIKIVKGMHYYGKYMDDIFIISNDKQLLQECLHGIIEIANRIGLFINEKKTKIVKVSKQFKFLNRMYRLTESGHLFEILSPQTIQNEKRKLHKLNHLLADGTISYKKIQNQYHSWIKQNYKHLSKTQLSSLNTLYDKLFINDWRDGYVY